jgi:hypothetical protein
MRQLKHRRCPAWADAAANRAVELGRSARTPEKLAGEFEPTVQSIWNWVRQAERVMSHRLV